jgi:hypothetical protein
MMLSQPPKFMKKSEVIEEIKGNNFPFGSDYNIKKDFELQIWKWTRI